MSTKKEKASWLAGLISGWGIKQVWAKLIAGAIIGALSAAGLLAGCASVTDEQLQSAHDLYHVITGNDCIIDTQK